MKMKKAYFAFSLLLGLANLQIGNFTGIDCLCRYPLTTVFPALPCVRVTGPTHEESDFLPF